MLVFRGRKHKVGCTLTHMIDWRALLYNMGGDQYQVRTKKGRQSWVFSMHYSEIGLQ